MADGPEVEGVRRVRLEVDAGLLLTARDIRAEISTERVWPEAVCSSGQATSSSGAAYGWLGPHHCFFCDAGVEEACRQFQAAVARGEYDEQGYTPAERKAQRKRELKKSKELSC